MTLKTTLAVLVLAVTPAAAETTMTDHSGHSAHMMHQMDGANSAAPSEPGQGAFAAIAEIVAMLESDPDTDWSSVNIDALREHLVDMSNVTLSARAVTGDIPGGVSFAVSGDGDVAASVRRMVMAHAGVMTGVNGWRMEAEASEGGATLYVMASADQLQKIKALGFFGIMALGMHHQAHHLMLATGQSPHGG